MKLFLDSKNRRFVKSAASNVALQTLVLKRRDQVPIEVIFVENGVAIDPPAGTQTTVALKSSFSDSNFLALAAPGQTILDLNTLPVEAAFSSSDPASISAFLEIRWTAPAQALRTATLQVEVQNSVILGDEATPAALPDGKATQAEAEAGLSNDKWMTPLRTAQAIAELAPPPTWASVLNKPTEFPPSSHTHTAAQITDFASAVVAVSPPVDWSSLTGKPTTFAPSAHTHLKSEITGLDADLAALATEDTALGQRIDDLLANLDPALIDSISEAVEVINTERTERIAADAALQSEIDGKATAAQGAKADTALQPEPVDYQGAYNNGADYSPGQVVSYNGELYIRIGEPNPGYPPPGSYWAVFDPSASPAFKLWVDLSKADTVHTHAATEITGLSSYIIASAPGLQINTTVRIGDGVATTFPIDGLVSSDPEHVLVALNGVTQTPTTDYLVSEASGTITFDSAPAAGMQISCTALGLRTVQPPIDPTLYLYAFDQSANGLTTYSGRLLNANRPAAPALPETATSWTVKRSTLNAAGRILATASATGSWANRETLAFA
jgi:hypothetical protein